MEVTYNSDKTIAFFDGYKFRKDKKTGYFLSTKKMDSGKRERLHTYLWRFYNGSIPEGYHIHHVDKDKNNNNIENLTCIPSSTHLSFHSKERAVTEHDKIIANLSENALPKAIEWHKSGQGRDWHKKHYNEMKDKLYVMQEYVCLTCGKCFKSTNTGSKFCCNSCKSEYRRKSGVDNETRICQWCGKEYVTNKYSKSETCSAKCRNFLRWDKKHKKNTE